MFVKMSGYVELELMTSLMNAKWYSGHRANEIRVNSRRIKREVETKRRVQN